MNASPKLRRRFQVGDRLEMRLFRDRRMFVVPLLQLMGGAGNEAISALAVRQFVLVRDPQGGWGEETEGRRGGKGGKGGEGRDVNGSMV